jgi:hypothetical protein
MASPAAKAAPGVPIYRRWWRSTAKRRQWQQKPGVSFATANDSRLLQDTPYDTADKLNLPNLARQISTISTLLTKGMADINDLPNLRLFRPTSAMWSVAPFIAMWNRALRSCPTRHFPTNSC